MDQRTGADNKPYAIGFAIALPDNWNGRFLFQGGGGLNGYILPPLGGQAAGDNPALARGFAVVSTDTGHKGAVFDAAFMKDQLASLNFAYIAVGRVAVMSKEIIAQYYGQPAKHSYYDGCSTGGREGMMMSQRYPTYFDGIIVRRSGDAHGLFEYRAHVREGSVRGRSRPRTLPASRNPRRIFRDGDKKLLADAIMKSCDEKDGLKDGMIFNPEACRLRSRRSEMQRRENGIAVSPLSRSARLQKAFAGPKDSHGNEVYAAFPVGHGLHPATPAAARSRYFPAFLPTAGPSIIATVNSRLTWTIDQLVAGVEANESQTLTDTTWTNLSTFFGHGGKLDLLSRHERSSFSPFDTLAYYEKMAASKWRPRSGEDWSRFFFVPGMNHCAGGPAALDKFDMLGAVVNWVENGVARIPWLPKGKAFPGRTPAALRLSEARAV